MGNSLPLADARDKISLMLSWLAALVLFLALVADYPKRYTERITIASAGRTAEITGEAAHVQFRCGPGPGNSINGVPILTGWIISDWQTEVQEPSNSLPRYEVVFHVTAFKETTREKQERYVVTYVYDPSTGHGYIRLPGKGEPNWDSNASMIYRGPQFEGHWFSATADWTNAAEAALQ
jgi:hypothetical protein